MKSVVVITPTIGSEHLKQCMESVANQTYDNVKHLIVVDGNDYIETFLDNALYDRCAPYDSNLCILPDNVGANGWYGHRVYAAFTYLVNEDYIIYLDEDNWLEPNHVESLIHTIESNNLLWAYSLRKICDKEGRVICEDNCESLGWWLSVDGYPHIDTSSYCVSRTTAVQAAHAWYGQWGADRQFFTELTKVTHRFTTNKEHTLNYRLDGNPGSPKKEFFIQGNIRMYEKYAKSGLAKLPWEKENGKN